jgi:hypothetical protein
MLLERFETVEQYACNSTMCVCITYKEEEEEGERALLQAQELGVLRKSCVRCLNVCVCVCKMLVCVCVRVVCCSLVYYVRT